MKPKSFSVLYSDFREFKFKDMELPYYAVIFTSMKTNKTDGYDKMAAKMVDLAKQQVGFWASNRPETKLVSPFPIGRICNQ